MTFAQKFLQYLVYQFFLKFLLHFYSNFVYYDLIFLYASPIQNEDGTEFKDHINYREEIKLIRKVLKKSNKRFKCIFECANKEIFRNALKKQTKILHISSHGKLNIEEEYKDKNKLNYSLVLEDKGKIQLIEKIM